MGAAVVADPSRSILTFATTVHGIVAETRRAALHRLKAKTSLLATMPYPRMAVIAAPHVAPRNIETGGAKFLGAFALLGLQREVVARDGYGCVTK